MNEFQRFLIKRRKLFCYNLKNIDRNDLKLSTITYILIFFKHTDNINIVTYIIKKDQF